MNNFFRVDVALAFALVAVAGFVGYFPVTAVVSFGVAMLTVNRWGTPAGVGAGARFGIRLAFFTALWVSAGVCGGLLRIAFTGELNLFFRGFTVLLVVGLSIFALRYLSRRVDTWWSKALA